MTLSSHLATPSHPFPGKPVGIGGWLLFLVIALTFIGPMFGVAATRVAIAGAEQATPDLVGNPAWSAITLTQYAGVAIASALGLAAGLLLVFRKKRGTPQRVMGLMVLVVVVPPVFEYVVYHHINPAFAGAMADPLIIQMARGAVSLLIWCSYLGVSKRVQNTYVE